MNNKIRIAISLLFTSSLMLCMEQEQQEHRDKCLQIRQKYEEKLQRYQKKLNTKTLQDLGQKKIAIENILQEARNSLIIKTHNLLIEIQKHHKTDALSWNLCRDFIINTLEQHETSLHLPFPKAYHDTTLHQNIHNLLSEKLKNNDIHPNRITINKNDTISLYCINYKAPSFQGTTEIKLSINENNFLKLSNDHQKAMCTCIAEEIAHGLPFIPHTIASLNFLPNVNSFIQSPEFIALQNMCTQKIHIFLACLNDPDTTSFMLQFMPDHCTVFSVNDYERVCKINICWTILKMIKPYNFIISLGTLMPKLAKINGARSANS